MEKSLNVTVPANLQVTCGDCKLDNPVSQTYVAKTENGTMKVVCSTCRDKYQRWFVA